MTEKQTRKKCKQHLPPSLAMTEKQTRKKCKQHLPPPDLYVASNKCFVLQGQSGHCLNEVSLPAWGRTITIY